MLMYIGQNSTAVKVDVHLPAQVTMVVIHKFGKTEPFCYAYVGGQPTCTVKPGSLLKKNPHANRV